MDTQSNVLSAVPIDAPWRRHPGKQRRQAALFFGVLEAKAPMNDPQTNTACMADQNVQQPSMAGPSRAQSHGAKRRPQRAIHGHSCGIEAIFEAIRSRTAKEWGVM